MAAEIFHQLGDGVQKLDNQVGNRFQRVDRFLESRIGEPIQRVGDFLKDQIEIHIMSGRTSEEMRDFAEKAKMDQIEGIEAYGVPDYEPIEVTKKRTEKGRVRFYGEETETSYQILKSGQTFVVKKEATVLRDKNYI